MSQADDRPEDDVKDERDEAQAVDTTEALVEDAGEETAPHGDMLAEQIASEPAPAGAAPTPSEVLDELLEEPIHERGSAELKSIVEALIFASPDPLTPKALFKLLSSEPKEDVQKAIAELQEDYQRPGGLQFVEVAGGYQIVTRPDLHEWVRRLFHERSTSKLSVQALETLAVVAYRQPVTALEITEIRGVNTSGVMNTLLERHLIKIVGRKQVVGRPFMYATTKDFLIRFGLNDLADLPKVEDMAEALGIESPLLVEHALPEEQLPLTEPDDEVVENEASADDESSGGSSGGSGESSGGSGGSTIH